MTTAFTSSARKKAFDEKFMKGFADKFKSDIKLDNLNNRGYPDCGSGRFSQELSYKAWYEFNNA